MSELASHGSSETEEKTKNESQKAAPQGKGKKALSRQITKEPILKKNQNESFTPPAAGR